MYIFKEIFKRTNTSFLIWIGATVAISNIGWRVVVNNFAVETVRMNGDTLGIMQSLREIPGLLAFTVIFCLIFIKEQTMVIISLSVLGIGVLVTGFFSSIHGFYLTTILMSVGFHYIESLSSSLTTQFYTASEFNKKIGILRSADSLFGIIGFIIILIMLNWFKASFKTVFFISGLIAFLISIYLFSFRALKTSVPSQRNKIIIRKKYTLFYILVFLSGARRQIFVVFAGFLLVQKFNFSVSNIAILFFISYLMTIYIAPKVAILINKIGYKKTLLLEYSLLTIIFVTYACAKSIIGVSILYILDSLAFSLALALKTYFKSIATPTEISSTTGLAFTINHIAAVFLPFVLGEIWLENYKYVFYVGAGFAIISILVSVFLKETLNSGPLLIELKNYLT